jgi:hypothetical protein
MPENRRDRFGDSTVHYSTTSDGQPFAYRPGHIITAQLPSALEHLRRLQNDLGGEQPELLYQKIDAEPDEELDNLEDDVPTELLDASTIVREPKWYSPSGQVQDSGSPASGHPSEGTHFLVSGVTDPLRAVMELRMHGIVAQPNHVYFAHGQQSGPFSSLYASPVYASPVYASPVYASPVYASPLYASPVYASPVYASPVYASPVYASPVYASPVGGTDALAHTTAGRTSSAVPAVRGKTTEAIWDLMMRPARGGARIFVLDTGLAAPGTISAKLAAQLNAPNPVRPLRPSDASDKPTALPRDHHLAPAAGHGTFIATVIGQVAPGCRVGVGKVLDGSGVGDEWTIARRAHQLAKRLSHVPDPERSVLSLSFGAPVLDHPFLLAKAISDIQATGTVVVASAGNDAMARPVFPAALPGVVGVGALGPAGPAPFTNHGEWVDACAPGVDLVSSFFTWKGGPGLDFKDWAIWSGTSFAAPIVAAALARLVMTAPYLLGHAISAEEARERLIDSPWLMRIPDLGTVVNVVWP